MYASMWGVTYQYVGTCGYVCVLGQRSASGVFLSFYLPFVWMCIYVCVCIFKIIFKILFIIVYMIYMSLSVYYYITLSKYGFTYYAWSSPKVSKLVGEMSHLIKGLPGNNDNQSQFPEHT